MEIALVHLRQAATGGTERYLSQLARHLAERGDDVTIVCRRHEDPPHPRVRFARLHGLAVGKAQRMSTFARQVEAHVARSRYDVVYGLGKTWTHDVVRLGGGCHATYLEHAHAATGSALERSLGLGARQHRLALAIEARALAPGAYRRVVVNSRMVAEDARRRHAIPPAAIDLVYNGVDLERYRPDLRAGPGRALRRELGWAEEDVGLLFLGTGYGRKGLDVLLEAVARLVPREPRLRLAVVGYDSHAARFADAARRLGLAERATFLGGRRDTETCYAAADLYALPTRYDPFANTTLEALASGLPVVTTAANGASELLAEGLAGSVVRDAEDAEALAEALARWCAPAPRAAGARAARALAERHASESKCRESAAILDRVASEKRAERAAAPA